MGLSPIGSASAPILVMRERCRFCLRFRSPSEMITTAVVAEGGHRICLQCLDWHSQALLALAGEKIPTGCPACNRPWSVLQLGSGASEQGVRMYLHGLDGVYVLLCRDCSDQVEQKRQAAYKGTPYGKAKKIL